jgi:hypothetical protein
VRCALALLALTIVVTPALACLWDRDTADAEARGIPEVVHVITGRFERNPPLYYEMRLRRVAAEIRRDPGNLALYDDAGVACDRLGRSDEANRWMDHKRAVLERLDPKATETREHRYRYLSNIGTFRAHRWLRSGADRSRIAEMKLARDEISAAVKLKPNAHFGREKYQLRAMEWIVAPPRMAEGRGLPSFVDRLGSEYEFDDRLLAGDRGAEVLRGLAGLIVLGDAWQSVDVFYALGCVLAAQERTSIAFLARLRCEELIDGGRRSVLPDAARGPELKRRLIFREAWALDDGTREALRQRFRELRREADHWQAQRTAFMLERLTAGRHPDTDASFWSGYDPPPAPRLDVANGMERQYVLLKVSALAAGASVVALGAFVVARRRVRKRPSKASPEC